MQRVLPHTGLPCIHIAWLVDHLGKNIMDYISSEFTAWRVKAIYGAKVSKFSDDLLKGIPLSKHVGPLLPAKYMWKTGTKEKSVQKDSNKEEESGGSLVNEQVISNDEQQEQNERRGKYRGKWCGLQ